MWLSLNLSYENFLYLVDIRIKYFVHNLEFPNTKDLNVIGNLLRSTNYIRKKLYLASENGEEEVELRSKFEQINIENSLLRGSVKFETVEEETDLSGKFNILIKSHKLDFFIGLNPRNHLTICGTASLARILTKIVSGILYGEEYGHIIWSASVTSFICISSHVYIAELWEFLIY